VPTAFPWDQTIGFGLSVLRLSPKEFWTMTPRELALAMGPFSLAKRAPSRAVLDEMLMLFPDGEDLQ
jgi:uncharacterized phage protein (TIGR02216 family)